VLLERQVQANLDSAEQQAAEAELMEAWPGRLKSEGWEWVRIRTASGWEIEVRVRYDRRRCDRRRGKRYRGVYAGWVLLGIHERCTPAQLGSAKGSPPPLAFKTVLVVE
jgi:hypothetical protein